MTSTKQWVITYKVRKDQQGQLYHDFYLNLSDGSKIFYLFSQNYRRGVHEYYRNGVRLSEAVDYSRSHRDSAIVRTMNKIPLYIRYVEQTEGLVVLDRTRRQLETQPRGTCRTRRNRLLQENNTF